MASARPANLPPAKALTVAAAVLAMVAVLWLTGRRPVDPTYRGRTATQWLAELRSPSGGYDMTQVSQALAAIGPQATNALLRHLTRPRFLPAPAVHWLGSRANSPWLLELASRREGARELALLGLQWCGADPAALVPDLLTAMDRYAEPQQSRRVNALLVRAGPAALEPILNWASQAGPDRAAIALEAAGLLLAPGQNPPWAEADLESPLRKLLGQTNTIVRSATLSAVRAGGGRAAALADAVVAAGQLQPVTPEIEWAAAGCLGGMAAHPAVAVPALAAWAGSSHEMVRGKALLSLAAFGPEAAPALRTVVHSLSHPAPSIRLPAVNVLSRIGPAAAGTAEPLIERLHDAEPIIRSGAARALGRIGAPPDRAVPALAAALGDPAPDVRRHAAEALGELGPGAALAVPELTKLLRDGEIPVRLAAIGALGRIGPGARAAVPELHAARNNDQSGVGRPVLEALARIEGAAPPAVGGWDAGAAAGR
ncbi:MAG: HEAT repeat domain-containing protein [Limisphaerales bacterium]